MKPFTDHGKVIEEGNSVAVYNPVLSTAIKPFLRPMDILITLTLKTNNWFKVQHDLFLCRSSSTIPDSFWFFYMAVLGRLGLHCFPNVQIYPDAFFTQENLRLVNIKCMSVFDWCPQSFAFSNYWRNHARSSGVDRGSCILATTPALLMALSLGLFFQKKKKKKSFHGSWIIWYMIQETKRVHKYKMDKIYKVTILFKFLCFYIISLQFHSAVHSFKVD